MPSSTTEPTHLSSRSPRALPAVALALASLAGCGESSEAVVPQGGTATAGAATTGAAATTAAVASTGMGTMGAAGSSGAADGSTTGPPPECFDDGECSAATPFCWQGRCVACDQVDDGDAACAELDPTRPACVAGRCEVCSATEASQCVGATPACDPTTNTCVGCMDHDDCPGGRGCHILEQRCLGGGVYEVDANGGADYTSLGDALAGLLEAGNEGTIVVHDVEAPSGIVVPSGIVAAILPGAGERPEVFTLGGPVVRVQSGGMAYIDGIRFEGLVLINLRHPIHTGLSIQGGMAYVTRSRINDIVVDQGGSLHLVNSIVFDNHAALDTSAVDVIDGSADILYSTLIGGSEPSHLALRCEENAAVTVRNSVMTRGSAGTTVDCDQGAFLYSLSYAPLDGVGNQRTSLTAPELFVDYEGDDFALSVAGFDATLDVARWNTGDPVVDFDGDARPHIHGASDHAGADVPGP